MPVKNVSIQTIGKGPIFKKSLIPPTFSMLPLILLDPLIEKYVVVPSSLKESQELLCRGGREDSLKASASTVLIFSLNKDTEVIRRQGV